MVLPVAFVTGLLIGGFERTSELDQLGEWLGAPDERGPACATLWPAPWGIRR